MPDVISKRANQFGLCQAVMEKPLRLYHRSSVEFLIDLL
jgi:hypothetical protein